jgi:flagellar basal-body rod protein FlgF
MDRMLYIAMSGAREAMQAQAVNANNLANVSTTGFRQELETLATREVQGTGFDSRAYGIGVGAGFDATPGSLRTTGRDLDVAIQGSGWLAVRAPDGGEAYTRAGDLRTDSAGRLVNGGGHLVLGNGGPVALPPNEGVTIGSDGSISIQPLGGDAGSLAQVDRLRLVDPPAEALTRGEDGLMRLRDGGGAALDAGVRVASGKLEGSNVDALDAMVRQLELAREFEVHTKMMRTARDNEQTSDQLLRLG